MYTWSKNSKRFVIEGKGKQISKFCVRTLFLFDINIAISSLTHLKNKISMHAFEEI